jgi:putative ABC transport system permease protein
VNFRQSLQFAVRGVLANRMRSVLTMSGIVIGVASVIILVAAGTGANAAATSSISSLGSNTLTITPASNGNQGSGGGLPGGGGRGGGVLGRGPGGAGAQGGAAQAESTSNGTDVRQTRLTLDDANALLDPELAPDVVSVAPVVTASGVTASYRGASHTVATFTGSTPAYLVNTNDSVQAGAVFTDSDQLAHNRVALVGTTVAEALAGGDGMSLVGEVVQLNGVGYQVVGILTRKGSTGPQDQDDKIIAPMNAVQDTLTGYGNLSNISVKATSAEVVDAATSEVTSILATRHGVRAADPDFDIFSATSILAAISTITGIFTVLLAGVAGISLLVGGIGVMNIMLVTVTERTREIGIRKAIGAQRSDIVGQFLLEAVLLSISGGIVGIAIGVGVGSLQVAGFQLIVAPFSIVLAFVVSVGIGLFFGYYPANKAAKLRPIEALRYE